MATMTLVPNVVKNAQSTAIDMYTAPVDVKEFILPDKVWEEKPPLQGKHRSDKEMGVTKDIFVEEGKRKVLRDYPGGRDDEGEARRKSLEKKRKETASREKAEDASLKTCRSLLDLEDSSLFEVDLTYVEPKPEFPGPYDPERPRQLYTNACEMLQIVPCSRFIHGLGSGRVIAGHQGFGPLGAKAVAISLITSLTVTELHLPNNKLGAEGMHYMARLIHGNEVIKVLDISDNGLGREGAKVLTAAIKENESIQQINAAGNNFDDKTGQYFEEALKANCTIKMLDLSRNQFCENGAILLARGMEENFTVSHLDLSYNHIRRYGVKGIARMLAINHSLLQLDLSWNGVDADMALVLGQSLNLNSCLSVFNLNGCRLNVDCLLKLLGNMKENRVLKTLQIADNPLTNADLELFLRALDMVPEMALSFIDASSVTVSQAILDLVENISKSRPGFMISYRGLLGIKDMSKNMLQVMDLMGGDPLEVIVTYARQKNLRLLDIFAQFDADKSGTMTRQELISGVAASGIPLSIKQLDKLVAKLDKDGDGEIDFSELFEGYKKLMRDLHKQGKVARTFLKAELEAFPGLVQQHIQGGKDARKASTISQASPANPRRETEAVQ